MAHVEVFEDAAALTRHAAERVVQLAAHACNKRGRFFLCLSGGNTPRALYALLATDPFVRRIDWARVELCFGDERCVRSEAPASNYGMTSRALFEHVPLQAQQIHRVATELPPQMAADDYEARLRDLLGVTPSGAPLQRFDLVLLGLGADGHTASLFPGSVNEPGRWVSARPSQSSWRITLTPQALNAAVAVFFLVEGPNKAEPLARVVNGPSVPMLLPAQRIVPSGALTWLVDRSAAMHLTSPRVVRRSTVVR